MADPRDTARQWLADTMCADLDIDLDKPSCSRCLEKADAILSAPGVYVGEFNINWLAQIDENGVAPSTTETRPVIWLPAEEGTGA
jgi:hypothetical protein